VKDLERFIDKSKPEKLLLVCTVLESFEKFPVDPYYEVVHDIDSAL